MTLADPGVRVIDLDLIDYTGPVTDADLSVVERCRGRVLDLGCGPARMVTAVTARGLTGLGVDIAPAAVALARSRGADVTLSDLFGPLPSEGRWGTALLLDGNIGIGGDVHRLLARCRTLIATRGRIVVETDQDPDADVICAMEMLDIDGRFLGRHRWARVGREPLRRAARRTGLGLAGEWERDGRQFTVLYRR